MEQQEIKSKIEDLVATASASNHPWDAWSLEFIESMEEKLNDNHIRLSDRQKEKILDLWEKI